MCAAARENDRAQVLSDPVALFIGKSGSDLRGLTPRSLKQCMPALELLEVLGPERTVSGFRILRAAAALVVLEQKCLKVSQRERVERVFACALQKNHYTDDGAVQVFSEADHGLDLFLNVDFQEGRRVELP